MDENEIKFKDVNRVLYRLYKDMESNHEIYLNCLADSDEDSCISYKEEYEESIQEIRYYEGSIRAKGWVITYKREYRWDHRRGNRFTITTPTVFKN